MEQPPLRRRDRRPNLDDDYYLPPEAPYHPREPYARRPHVIQDEPPIARSGRAPYPPRRHPSPDFARPRRQPSPDFYRRDEPPRGRSDRFDRPSRSVDRGPRDGGRRRSPPGYTHDPPRRLDRSVPLRDRDYDPRRPLERSAPLRDYGHPRDHPRGPPGRRPISPDRDRPPRPRSYAPPDSDMRRSRSMRNPSPERRPRGGGGYHSNSRHDDFEPRRRPVSHQPLPRRRERDDSPPRGRSYRPDGDTAAAAAGAGAGVAAAGRGARAIPRPRRNSMPANATRVAGNLWKNPLVKAGGRAFLTAGAQAAMKSRNEKGGWMGPKGAKVATAALGAALVDSFISQKHPGGGDLAHEGVGFATEALGSRYGRH